MPIKFEWAPERITRAARSGGVNWTRPIHVLVRFVGDKLGREVWKTQGHTRKQGILSEYSPPELLLVVDAERHWRSYSRQLDVVELQEGGRFGPKCFLENREAIKQFFGGIDLYEQLCMLHNKTTLLVSGKGK